MRVRSQAIEARGGGERRRSRWWIRTSSDHRDVEKMPIGRNKPPEVVTLRLRLDFSAVSPVISHGFPPRSVLLLLERLTSADLFSEISGDGEHLTRQTLPSDQSALLQLPLMFLPLTVLAFKGRTVPTRLKPLM